MLTTSHSLETILHSFEALRACRKQAEARENWKRVRLKCCTSFLVDCKGVRGWCQCSLGERGTDESAKLHMQFDGTASTEFPEPGARCLCKGGSVMGAG